MKTSPTPLTSAPEAPAPLATSLDRVIHERSRLALLAHLAVRESASFSQLRAFLELSDGNLSTHLRVLESAGLVRIIKEGRGRSSSTQIEMTELGKTEFSSYLEQLENVIRRARSGLGH